MAQIQKGTNFQKKKGRLSQKSGGGRCLRAVVGHSGGVPAVSRQMNSLPEVCKLWWIGKPQAITDHLARHPKFQTKTTRYVWSS